MIKIGKTNQIYGKFVRILLSSDNPNEILIVLEKDRPMARKYIKQFEDMFAGQDVIITIKKLIREKNKGKLRGRRAKTEEGRKTRKGAEGEQPSKPDPFYSYGEGT